MHKKRGEREIAFSDSVGATHRCSGVRPETDGVTYPESIGGSRFNGDRLLGLCIG